MIKSGRSPAAQRLLNTTAGMDPAWDAAIQRAGLLRVQDTHELFSAAARSASRNKPILVIKSGRSPAAQRLLNTTAGMDPAWDAAIQRAGLLRVQDTHELFSAVETLSHMRPLRGDRLMIISNGAAPAALALIQRAGLLRVQDTHELFSAVETLSHMRPLRGDRLMIISNGAAPAALALDALWSRNGP